MRFEVWGLGFRVWVWGLGFVGLGVWGLGVWGFEVWGLECGVWGLGVGDWGSGFESLGFEVWGLDSGSRVQGSGVGVPSTRVFGSGSRLVQGYLAHKKMPPPGTPQ